MARRAECCQWHSGGRETSCICLSRSRVEWLFRKAKTEILCPIWCSQKQMLMDEPRRQKITSGGGSEWKMTLLGKKVSMCLYIQGCMPAWNPHKIEPMDQKMKWCEKCQQHLMGIAEGSSPCLPTPGLCTRRWRTFFATLWDSRWAEGHVPVLGLSAVQQWCPHGSLGCGQKLGLENLQCIEELFSASKSLPPCSPFCTAAGQEDTFVCTYTSTCMHTHVCIKHRHTNRQC